ncbi:MAG: hypothetical protein KAT68_05530 [Bacteroidales bacterium]|nr:hypothetical protein [Bacteroidales bacterium]
MKKQKNILKYLILGLTGIIIISSCNKKITKQEMFDYLKNPENGLLQEKTINGINIKVMFKPSSLFVLQEINNDTTINDEKIQKLKEQYNKYLYFIISFSQNKQELLNLFAGNQQQFGAMVNQLAFDMDNNVSLISSKKDTLPLMDYIYPRLYGMSNSTDILFVFKKEELKNFEWLKLTIKDFGLKIGDTKYKFYIKAFKKIPELKIN